jgi:hypothetical protein
MSAIQVKTQTIETVYITMPGLEKKVRVSNPDKIPNLEKVLVKKYPVVLRASWGHNIDKVFTNSRLTDFDISWLEPTDKGGLSLFLCEKTAYSSALLPSYGLVYYQKGDCDTDEPLVEIKVVTETNCFPWK